MIEPESELHDFRITCFQGNAEEATKFLDRAGHGADFVSNVELHNFVAAHYAGVADFHGDFGFARNPDRGGRQAQAGILERRGSIPIRTKRRTERQASNTIHAGIQEVGMRACTSENR